VGFQVLLANCLAHGRRHFVDVAGSFPDECIFAIETLRDVFRNDAVAKEQELSPEARLAYHQVHSGPIMDKLRAWMQAQFDEKRVEPNSGLGKAIKYMFNHWEALTLFLRKAGAPLENNLCERALKMAIRHRTNSLFYKTENGARVGDIFMTLIHTCALAKKNAFHYLTQLLKHAPEVARNPRDWLPWTYEATLCAIASG
jgi:transposase